MKKTRTDKLLYDKSIEWCDVHSAERAIKAEKAIHRQVVIDKNINTDVAIDNQTKNNTISMPKFRQRIGASLPYPNLESLYERLVVGGIYTLGCVPYKKYIDKGYFVYAPITTTVDGLIVDVPNYQITPLGQERLIKYLTYGDITLDACEQSSHYGYEYEDRIIKEIIETK